MSPQSRTQPINVPNQATGSQGRSLSFPFLRDTNSREDKFGTSIPKTTPSPQAQNGTTQNQGKEGDASKAGLDVGKSKFGFTNRSPRKYTGPKPTHPTIVANGTIIPNFLGENVQLQPAKPHTNKDNVSNYGATAADWSKAADNIKGATKSWVKRHKRGSSREDSGGERRKVTLKPRLSPDQQH